jgi:hypothetical protein
MPALTGKWQKVAVWWKAVSEWVAESVGIFCEFFASWLKF